MAGTALGAKNTALTNKMRYGKDYYKRIGSIGGKAENPNKGFGYDPEKSRKLGAQGGRLSKRGLKFICIEDSKAIYEDKEGNIKEYPYEAI